MSDEGSLDNVSQAGPLPLNLTRASLGSDPVAACAGWLEEAYDRCEVGLPNAVCLSTVDEDGRPEGRIVLVKSVEPRGVVFFTNYRSKKARSLAHTPHAAMTFYWPELLRQIRVRGSVVRISPEESDAYFKTRPRGSQIGAWASDQSEPLESRATLEARFEEFVRKFNDAEIRRPDHWGGYVLEPVEIEFWQGRNDRLHDRIQYTLRERKGSRSWTTQRVNP